MPSFLGHGVFAVIKYQWQLFSLAVMFFSRLPVSNNIPYSTLRMNQANRYFSSVGIVIGGLLALVFYAIQSIFPLEITVILIMICSVLLTGAFHEDGLADMADGIGGGYTVEKRLLIMKDSRIGTYGSVSLLLALLLKFYLLLILAQHGQFIFSLIFAYGLSRALAASLIFNTQYVSDAEDSKSKPLAAQQSLTELLLNIVVAVLPCLFIETTFPKIVNVLLLIFVSLCVFRFCFRRWLIARIGGFTGDCLGAAQQISELIIYLVFVSQLSHAGLS